MTPIIILATALLLTTACDSTQSKSTAQNDTGRPTAERNEDAPSKAGEAWTTYRDYTFASDKDVIQAIDTAKAAQIAAHLKANPTLQVGIDASTNPRATEPRDVELSARRVTAIREALVAAGVPTEKISDGQYGDMKTRRADRVEVLTRSAALSQAE